jgi:D-xylose transport system ATP-binding protein
MESGGLKNISGTILPGLTKPTPIVRCQGISKFFGGVKALDTISVDFYPREITALVGDNGAGKSTLVKIISGLLVHDEGELWIGDGAVDQLTPRKARYAGIETVHQNLLLCDNLDIAANVVLGDEPTRFRLGPLKIIDQEASREKARTQLDRLGTRLPDLSMPVERLSGGQRQAIAIARAIMKAHRLVLLDEPTAALGLRQTEATLEVIRRVAQTGVGVILISHNLDNVFAVANRIVALRQGKIAWDAPAAATTRETLVAAMTGLLARPAR